MSSSMSDELRKLLILDYQLQKGLNSLESGKHITDEELLRFTNDKFANPNRPQRSTRRQSRSPQRKQSSSQRKRSSRRQSRSPIRSRQATHSIQRLAFLQSIINELDHMNLSPEDKTAIALMFNLKVGK